MRQATGFGEAAVRQQALADQQANLVREVVSLESRVTSLRAALDGASGAERDQVEKALRSVQREIAGVNASLAETRQKLGNTVVEVPAMPAMPPMPEAIAMVPPPFPGEKTMFGYTRNEFIGGGSFILLLPLALAAARAMWRRGGAPSAPRDSESANRLARLEQAVESVAVEVERIGESQRFTTRILTERQPDFQPAGESARPMGDIRR